MTQATKATVSEIRNTANQHRDAADSFDQQSKSVQQQVDGLRARNKGELMDKLDDLQNEWSANVKQVTEQIRNLAAYLDDAATKIEAQDAGSGGGLT